jgi:hypothetical protein
MGVERAWLFMPLAVLYTTGRTDSRRVNATNSHLTPPSRLTKSTEFMPGRSYAQNRAGLPSFYPTFLSR